MYLSCQSTIIKAWLNINRRFYTKVSLGNELTERNAIIRSASQDLSTDDRNIASVDKGETIISSNFTKFAVPINLPLFEDVVLRDSQTISIVKKKQRIGVIG